MNETPPLIARPEPTRRPLALIFFALFAILVLYATGRILFGYVTPILLAVVIVTFTHPTFRRLRERFKGRQNLAATIMLIMITLVLVLPAVVLGFMLFNQADALFKVLQKTDVHRVMASTHLTQRLMFIKRFYPSFDPSSIQPEAMVLKVVREIPAYVAAHGAAFFGGAASAVLGFFLMLLAAFYFYVEGEALTKQMIFLSPLPDEYDREIFQRFRGVIDATFKGQILTALAQGLVTTIGLFIAGVPAALFWGAVAAVFALVPMVGPAMVWIPSAIYLFLGQGARGGGIGWGLFMVAWGVLVVSLVDNVIRPWAMKGGLDMPAVVLFFAILGGLQAFGFVGLVLGPLVFALLDTLIHMYKNFFANTLAAQNAPVEQS